MKDLALLVLRGAAGGLMVGHGAQKLFGVFGGYGLAGTAGWLESQGLRPGKAWAMMAGAGEFGGGVLTALGLLNPLGPLGIAGAMVMATGKAHWGKPIWVTEGGAELPLTNIAIATALALAGPGKYSVDEKLGLRLPAWLPAASALASAAVIGYGLYSSRLTAQPIDQQQPIVQEQPALDAEVTSDETMRLPLAVPAEAPAPTVGLRVASKRSHKAESALESDASFNSEADTASPAQ